MCEYPVLRVLYVRMDFATVSNRCAKNLAVMKECFKAIRFDTISSEKQTDTNVDTPDLMAANSKRRFQIGSRKGG